MAGTFVVNGDSTITVAFSYTAQAAIVQTTADAAAHRLYDSGRYVLVDAEGEAVPWDDLTNQQKLNMLDKFVLEGVHEMALGYLHDVRQADARAYREEDAGTIL